MVEVLVDWVVLIELLVELWEVLAEVDDCDVDVLNEVDALVELIEVLVL